MDTETKLEIIGYVIVEARIGANKTVSIPKKY